MTSRRSCASSGERDAVILAHNYMTPEIFHCVADIVGDSLALAREAMKADAKVIVLAGVHFMAETAKLLNPDKTVLIPDSRAGCSLAESLPPPDVRLMRERHPGVPVVTYVNSSAAVKAESDICCTSGNALKSSSHWASTPLSCCRTSTGAEHRRPDTVKILTWAGHCKVHERFTAAEVRPCAGLSGRRRSWRIRNARRRSSPRPTTPVPPPTCPPMSAAQARPGRPADRISMADNVSVHHP